MYRDGLNVLIVAKTRRGKGACIGGITLDGKSVRLEAADAPRNEQAGREYNVSEVWAIDARPAPQIIPPHVENVVVYAKHKTPLYVDPVSFIDYYMKPKCHTPRQLYEGLVQRTNRGVLYIAERTGIPPYSTMFWRPDQPLTRDESGKRIRYRYGDAQRGCTLTFVGFQEPVKIIPANALIRVSLAHWWRPPDHPQQEKRCYVQLSGWYTTDDTAISHEVPIYPG